MNRSYSKLRNINNTNTLLEQKYLEDKRNADLGVLTEAFDRSSLSKTIDKACSENLYGSGSFSEDNVNVFAEWFKKNLSLEYKSNDHLKLIAKSIRNMETISNYCRVAKKYKAIGGSTYNDKVIDFMSKMVYYDNAWQLYIQLPFEDIIKNAEVAKEKGNSEYLATFVAKEKSDSEETTTGGGSDDYYAKQEKIIDKTQAVMTRQENLGMSEEDAKKIAMKELGFSEETTTTGGGTTTTSGGGFGTIYPNVFTSDVIKTIKQKISSSDISQSLTQDDINKLYDAINKLP